MAPMAPILTMATMAPLCDANGCSIGANGDSVSGANGDHNRHWRYCRHWCHCRHWHQWITIDAIVVNCATGSIGAIGSPNYLLTLNGDCELSITIEWIKWHDLNGTNGRQSMSPLAPLTESPLATMEHPLAPLIVAIGADGANGAK